MSRLYLIGLLVTVVTVVVLIIIEKKINDRKMSWERKSMRTVIILDCIAGLAGFFAFVILAMSFKWDQ